MTQTTAETESATGPAIESVGMVCARAVLVALVVGVVEGNVLARVLDTKVTGFGLATAGLWVPAALVSLLVVLPLRRMDESARRVVRAVLIGMLAASFLYVKLGRAPLPMRVAPAEILSVLAVAWVASSLKLEGALRKVVAYAGIALTLVLQIHANRWVDAHRAYAGAMSQSSFVPRLMLRSVLRRVT